jgi:hypothetical protein
VIIKAKGSVSLGMTKACWGFVDLEVLEERAERLLICSVILPSGKVANMTMLESCSPTSVAFQHDIIQTNGKEHILTAFDLLMESGVDFTLDPCTINSILGQNEQEFVLHVNGLFDPTQDRSARAKIVRRKPAGNVFFAQIGIEPFGENLILVGMAYEERLVLNGSRCEERWQVLDLGFGKANATQEMQAGVPIGGEDD